MTYYSFFFVFHLLLILPPSSLCKFPHLRHYRLHSDERKGDTMKQDKNKNEEQEIFIHVGPMKTATSSLQLNLKQWYDDNILQHWSWSEPPNILDNYEFLFDESLLRESYGDGKGFFPFGDAIVTNCRKDEIYWLKDDVSCDMILQEYKEKFQKDWDDGFSLIIATEFLGLIQSEDEDETQMKIKTMMDQLPASSSSSSNTTVHRDDVTVVLHYRSPRARHLFSWWAETRANNHFDFFMKNEMFDHVNAYGRQFRVIDSLNLAKSFLNAGLNVILIDLSGVWGNGYDSTNIVACEILNIPCTEDKTLIGAETHRANDHSKTITYLDEDIGPLEKKEIKRMIRSRDCSSYSVLNDHPNLQVLYPKDYIDVMKYCEESKDEGISWFEMYTQMQNLVLNHKGNNPEEAD